MNEREQWWKACAESKQSELDKANARIAQLEECLVPFMKIISTSSGRIQTEKLSFADWHGMIKAASESPYTWILEHDKAAEAKGWKMLN